MGVVLYEIHYYDSQRKDRHQRISAKDEQELRQKVKARKIVSIKRVGAFHAYCCPKEAV